MSDDEQMLIVHGLAGLRAQHALGGEQLVQHQVLSVEHARLVALRVAGGRLVHR